MKQIPLTQGFVALVDDWNYERLSKHNWYAAVKAHGRLVYAQREVRFSDGTRTTIQLHQIVLPPKSGLITDHKSGNTLDCREHNLRYSTYLNNGSNKRKPFRRSTSQFKGVCWAKDRQKWRAAIRVNWKLINLGQFDCEKSAARAYDAAAKKYFGEFACLNFK